MKTIYYEDIAKNMVVGNYVMTSYGMGKIIRVYSIQTHVRKTFNYRMFPNTRSEKKKFIAQHSKWCVISIGFSKRKVHVPVTEIYSIYAEVVKKVNRVKMVK